MDIAASPKPALEDKDDDLSTTEDEVIEERPRSIPNSDETASLKLNLSSPPASDIVSSAFSPSSLLYSNPAAALNHSVIYMSQYMNPFLQV